MLDNPYLSCASCVQPHEGRRHFRRLFELFTPLPVLLALFGVSLCHAAQSPEPTYTVDLPAGPAATVLNTVSQITNAQFVYRSAEIDGVKTQGIHGAFTLPQILERILAGTPLAAVRDSESGAYAIAQSTGKPGVSASREAPRTNAHRSSNLEKSKHLPEKEMNSKSPTRRSLIATILAIGTAIVSPSSAQTGADADKSVKEESPIVLSPFVVTADDNQGYVATETLSGTRIKTDLRDLGASISVYTPQFLQDIGAVRTEDLLVYATGAEVVGIGGNYSGSNVNGPLQEFQGDRQSATPTTRLRGLDSATFSRNNTQTSYNFDSYNIERIEINRGANAILFGLASPSGIINADTNHANDRRNFGSVDLRADQYGSWRANVDYNRALIKDKLALRVDLMDDQRKYEQDPAHRDEKRGYIALTAKLTPTTTLRANFETGKLFEVQPMLNPPNDGITAFYDDGQVLATSPITVIGGVSNPNRFGGVDPSTVHIAQAGDWFRQPAAIFSDPNSSAVDVSFPAIAQNGTVPAAQRIQYQFSAPAISSSYAVQTANPLGGFMVARQILDRSVFDYRKHKLEGDSAYDKKRFHAYDLSLEQLFFHGHAGIDATYSGGDSTTENFVTSNNPYGDGIFIDINQQTPDGRPNPNVGRPFRASIPVAHKNTFDYSDLRLTGFTRFDFRDHLKNWFGRMMGEHTVTAFYNDTENKSDNRNFLPVVGGNFIDGQGSSSSGARTIVFTQYLGPSVIGTSGMSGLNIPGVSASQWYPDSLQAAHIWDDTGRVWQVDTFPVLFSPNDTVNSAARTRQTIKSQGLIWHAKLFDGNIVPTLGWRNDKTAGYRVDAINGANGFKLVNNDPSYTLPDIPSTTQDVNIFSWGIVGHLPSSIKRKLPLGLDPSIFYNESENFSDEGVRLNLFRENLPPPLGHTKEYGVAIGMFNNKLSLRVTKYETTQENIIDSRLRALDLGQIEMRVWNYNDAAVVQSLGYVGSGSSGVSEVYQKFLTALNFSKDPQRADGTTPVQYGAGGLNAVTSSQSEGYEMELVANPTKNWRIALNVTQQKASRGPVDPIYKALYDDRLIQWAKPGIRELSGGPGGVDDILDGRIGALVDSRYLKVVLSDGQNVNELIEWRWNFVTNYTFDRASRFGGLSVGTGLRWQDKNTIGFLIRDDPDLGLIEDPLQPFFGPSQLSTDLWFNYQLPYLKKYFKKWTVGLRIQNVFNDNQLIPVRANPVAIGSTDFEVGAYRMGAARTWQFSTRFEF